MSLTDPMNGVYPSQWIRQAIANGTILADQPFVDSQIQPNSLDLRIASEGHRVQCSFLPGQEGMSAKLEKYSWYSFKVPEAGIVLERNQIYLFPLCESLRLTSEVKGCANPKSTTGRLDVFTRLVTEYGTSFDEAPYGYTGRLYLEVVPRSFAVCVRPGDTLSQIRFQIGNPRLNPVETIELLNSQHLILDYDQRTMRSEDLDVQNGIVLSIHLPRKIDQQRQPTIGFQALKNVPPVDLRARGLSRRRYWNRMFADSKPVILEPDEFYIFRSRELVCLPPQICAEMVAFEASSGEVRTHYAGFFDTGFGYRNGLSSDTTAAGVVLEVRSRDVPFLIEDGQPLFRIHLLRCTEEPDALYGASSGSNYQSQRDVRLSKQFSTSTEIDEDEGQTRFEFD